MRSGDALRVIADSLRPDGGGTAGARRRAKADWETVIRLANENYLTPAMQVAMSGSGTLAQLPDEVRDYLAFLHEQNGERNEALREELFELIAAFNRAGLEPLVLKGGLIYFMDHYPDRAARMLTDLDLLVPRERLPETKGVLERLGFVINTVYEPIQHAYAEFMREGSPGAVDVHVEVVDANYLITARELWARAQTRDDRGLRFFVPSATDAIMHNLWHAQIHHIGGYYRGLIVLRQIYDFAMLARLHGTAIDWRLVEARAAQNRLTPVLHSHVLAAHQLFGLEWPLSRKPLLAARLHQLRCRVHLRHRALDGIGLVWGNLRAAFATHRMRALYSSKAPLPALWLHHAARFFLKSERQGFVGRLFRVS